MTTWGEPLVVVAIREGHLGDRRRETGRPLPHRLWRLRMAGGDVVVEENEDDVAQVMTSDADRPTQPPRAGQRSAGGATSVR